MDKVIINKIHDIYMSTKRFRSIILPDIYLINGFTEVPLKSNKFLINKYYITFCSIICLICQLVVLLYY